jgi:DNA-binding LytR/AlgR family response regulator
MILRCVAVDDEPFALEILQDFVARVPFLQLEAACHDPLDAMSVIQRTHPDLLFLDIEMPEISGIRIAEVVERPPYIIFTTAYSQYAVEGFNLNALDYLLKPFSFDRFLKAVTKAQDAVTLQKSQPGQQPGNEFIIVKSDYQNLKIKLNDILYIEAMDNYVRIFTPQKTCTPLMNLKTIAAMLPGDRFVRIHKSFIIAMSQIKAFTKDYVTVGKKQIPIGRAFSENFAEAVRKWH